MSQPDQSRNAATRSEFDLQPGEEKLPCGCFAVTRTVGRHGKLVITGQAFLCDRGHRLYQEVKRDAD